jgi:hypothetical protein
VWWRRRGTEPEPTASVEQLGLDYLDQRGGGGGSSSIGGNTGPQLAVDGYHTCAPLHTGLVKCWGDNFFGQLGLGDTNYRGDGANEMGGNLPAVELGIGRSAVELVAGYEHTCARLDNGRVKCWGQW